MSGKAQRSQGRHEDPRQHSDRLTQTVSRSWRGSFFVVVPLFATASEALEERCP